MAKELYNGPVEWRGYIKSLIERLLSAPTTKFTVVPVPSGRTWLCASNSAGVSVSFDFDNPEDSRLNRIRAWATLNGFNLEAII